ncbi:hypothetical protein D3C87_1758560 [compost metagenome]
MRLVAEYKRHVEHVHVRHHRPDDAQADPGHLDGADLGLFHHFFFRAEHTAGEHLECQLAVTVGHQSLAQLFFRHHGRVTGGVDVGEFDFQRLGGAAEGEGERCSEGEVQRRARCV